MTSRTITVATQTDVTLYEDPDEANPWRIEGDLRAPGSGWDGDENYTVRDALQPVFPEVDFDPESACFFAYCKTEEEADALVEAIRGWMLLHDRNTVYTADQLAHGLAEMEREYDEDTARLRARIAELEAEVARLHALSRIGLKPPVPFGPEVAS